MNAKNSGSPHEPKRILIVDDHPIVRQGLRSLIEQEPDLTVCAEAADAPSALEYIRKNRPDLAVIDLSLKEGSGTELVKQIRHLDADVKMLVASVYNESLYAERVIRAGAMGFVRKDEGTAAILKAIREVLNGRIYLSGPMTDHLLQRLAAGKDPESSPLSNLTDRELEVFQMIGQGMATREIAEKLCLSIKTVETHRENIKEKLELKTSTELSYHAIQWMQQNQ
jgi:DNA-binding NarL/FixJ family response regulator